ncbi:MAG TPA: ArdC-like ssDNA-binding domain-containing protein [Acidimicrobiales bacterium]|nr:ArdC-like ssDNA-binding domain-containing protein [Acidimicrobiales bacterium]
MAANGQHAELVNRLTEGIADLTSSDRWRRYLDFQSRFHRYSAGNVLLILSQRPDATRVAGFRAWQALDRSVRRGERALWILAPMVRRRCIGDPEGEARIGGFKWVPVFDVSQTEGADLPSVCRPLSGDDDGPAFERLIEIATLIGFRVEDHRFDGPTNGDCCHRRRRIRVEVARSARQRVKTLAHELAHAILHERVGDRSVAELEAESTAYVVCQHLGIDTAEYTFGYVATWAGGGAAAIAAIKASCDRIQRAADTIVGSLALRHPLDER